MRRYKTTPPSYASRKLALFPLLGFGFSSLKAVAAAQAHRFIRCTALASSGVRGDGLISLFGFCGVCKLWSCLASDSLCLLTRYCVVFCCWGVVVEGTGSVLSVRYLYHGALVAMVRKVAAFQSGGERERESI